MKNKIYNLKPMTSHLLKTLQNLFIVMLQVGMVMGPGSCWTRPFFKDLGLNFLDPLDTDPGLDPEKIWRVRVLRWRPGPGPGPQP